jgi:hypothetical protein
MTKAGAHLTPRNAQPLSRSFCLRRDPALHGAVGARLSSALSSSPAHRWVGAGSAPHYSGSLVCSDSYFAMIRISFDRFVDPPATSAVKAGTQEHITVDLKAVSVRTGTERLVMVAVGRYNGP